MKKIVQLFIVFVLITLKSKAQFEGTFTLTIHTDRTPEPTEMFMFLKSDLMCMEVPYMQSNGFIKGIVNNTNQTLTTCIDKGGRKVAMQSNLNDMERFMPVSANAKPPVFTETDEQKKISGFNCKKVLMKSDDSEGEFWITQDWPIEMSKLITAVSANKSPGSAMLRGLGRIYANQKGISLETQITNIKNKEKYSVLITDIKAGFVDEKQFNIDDFQLMEMPTMGGGQIKKTD